MRDEIALNRQNNDKAQVDDVAQMASQLELLLSSLQMHESVVATALIGIAPPMSSQMQ